jgi:hypothetical protein
MRKVFEEKREDLIERAGDTSSVINIQQHVKRMFEEGEAEQERIRQQIAKQGPAALPGVLNAAYVFADQMKRSERDQLADLLTELVNGNQAAREMLLRTGVLEAPFVPTRRTALRALRQLGEISERELQRIRERADRDAEDGDYKASELLYEFLIQHDYADTWRKVKEHAKDLFQEAAVLGPSYLDLALRGSPENVYSTLSEVMREATETSLDNEIENQISMDAVANLPEILRAAADLVSDYSHSTSRKGKHKGLEYLFLGPIAKYLKAHPDEVSPMGQLVKDNYQSDFYEYWWRGLGRIVEVEEVREHFAEQTSAGGRFAFWGTIQLFFVRDRSSKFKLWAKDLLEKLEEESPYQYSEAEDRYDEYKKAPRGPEPDNGGPEPPSSDK